MCSASCGPMLSFVTTSWLKVKEDDHLIMVADVRGNAPIKHPTALSNLIDPFSKDIRFVSPHLHARDHSSNALALAQVS